MRHLRKRYVFLVLAALSLMSASLACAGQRVRPTVSIASPDGGEEVLLDEEVEIQVTATDRRGLERVELWADGSLVESDTSVAGSRNSTVTFAWTPDRLGLHVIGVRAVNQRGVSSLPRRIALRALASQAVGEAAPPPSGGAAPPAAPAAPGVELPELPPLPTDEPVSGECTDGMEFVADVNVPDGTVFAPGETFTKTWQVRNSGTCDWSGYELIFVDGEPMGDRIGVPDMPAGETFDISLGMTAPIDPGDYIGRWALVSDGGATLGHLTCVITVEEPGGEEGEEEEQIGIPPNNPSALGVDDVAEQACECRASLVWTDNADDEDGFVIESQELGRLAEIGEADVESFRLEGLPCGAQLTIRVRAYNEFGLSDASNVVEFVTPPCAEAVDLPDLYVNDIILTAPGQLGAEVCNGGEADATGEWGGWAYVFDAEDNGLATLDSDLGEALAAGDCTILGFGALPEDAAFVAVVVGGEFEEVATWNNQLEWQMD
jgi:hypothetical protein